MEASAAGAAEQTLYWGEDTIYCEAVCHPDDVLYEGSEDEHYSDSETRKSRYAAAGRRFLEGDTPYLISSALKGPFEQSAGWSNPWLSRRHADRTVPTRPRSSIRPIPSSMHKDPTKKQTRQPQDLSPACHLPSPESLKQAPFTDQHPFMEEDDLAMVHSWRNGVQSAAMPAKDRFWSSQPEVGSCRHKRKASGSEWLKKVASKRRRTGSDDFDVLQTPCQHSGHNINFNNANTSSAIVHSSFRSAPVADQRYDTETEDELGVAPNASFRSAPGRLSAKRLSPRRKLWRGSAGADPVSEDELTQQKLAAAALSSPTSNKRAAMVSAYVDKPEIEQVPKDHVDQPAANEDTSDDESLSDVLTDDILDAGVDMDSISAGDNDLSIDKDSNAFETQSEESFRFRRRSRSLKETSKEVSLSDLEDLSSASNTIVVRREFEESEGSDEDEHTVTMQTADDGSTEDAMSSIEVEVDHPAQLHLTNDTLEEDEHVVDLSEAEDYGDNTILAASSDKQFDADALEDTARASLSSSSHHDGSLQGPTNENVSEEQEDESNDDEGTKESSSDTDGEQSAVDRQLAFQDDTAETEQPYPLIHFETLEDASSPLSSLTSTPDIDNSQQSPWDTTHLSQSQSTLVHLDVGALPGDDFDNTEVLVEEDSAMPLKDTAPRESGRNTTTIDHGHVNAPPAQPIVYDQQDRDDPVAQQSADMLRTASRSAISPATERPRTPEPQFSVKSFASFMSPSPEMRRRHPRRQLYETTPTFVSTTRVPLSAVSGNSRASLSSKKSVSWALLPHEVEEEEEEEHEDRMDTGDSPSGPPRNCNRMRALSPPPAKCIAELPTSGDVKFQGHFAKIAGLANDLPHRVPSTASQDACDSPGTSGAMTDKSMEADELQMQEGSGEAARAKPAVKVGTTDSAMLEVSQDPLGVAEDLFRDMLQTWDVDAELDQARKVVTPQPRAMGVMGLGMS